jgi:hypothetical protein
MPKFARINERDEIEVIREFPEAPDPNPAKGWRWVHVEDTPGPDHSSKLETAIAVRVVDGAKVVTQWTVARRPIAEQNQAVKDEARRRILSRYPEWRQANMTARGVELTLTKIAREWTPEEQGEADTLQGAWDWVESVRAASDAIEALSPIPADFRDDKHWPEQ